MTCAGLIAVAAVGMLCFTPSAGWAARGQSLNLTAGIASWYDNNLLQYSDPQIAQFESGLFPNRFSIETRDDLTFNPTLELTWELDRGRGRRHDLRVRGEGEFHDRDRTADMRSASLAWREYFGGGQRLLLRGYHLPSYYLRQLRDVTTGFYERAQFGLTIGEASWSQALRAGIRLAASCQFERRTYSPRFPERTSDTSQGELTLGFDRLPHRGHLEIQGAYRSSLADGRNLAGGAASVLADPSYHGWWGGANGRIEFLRRGSTRIGGDLSYRYERRDYDSNRPADKSHIGRHDGEHVVEVGLRAQLRPHWTIRGFDQYDSNQASYGQTVVLTNDPGSYRQNRVGLELAWSGDVWKQARSPAIDEEGGK